MNSERSTIDQVYDDIFDTWMQEFIDSVPLTQRHRQQQRPRPTRTVFESGTTINTTTTIRNGRVVSSSSTSSDDALNEIIRQLTPQLISSALRSGREVTTVNNYSNGVLRSSHTNSSDNAEEPANDRATASILQEFLHETTADMLSSMFDGNGESRAFEDVKVALPKEQFDKLERISFAKCECDTCHVCMEEFSDDNSVLIKLPCAHVFHQECISRWLCNEKVTCPVCRSDVRDLLKKSEC